MRVVGDFLDDNDMTDINRENNMKKLLVGGVSRGIAGRHMAGPGAGRISARSTAAAPCACWRARRRHARSAHQLHRSRTGRSTSRSMTAWSPSSKAEGKDGFTIVPIMAEAIAAGQQ